MMPARVLALIALAALAVGCGLPSEGGHTVDDVSVPYHLLDDRAAPDGSGGDAASSTAPLVFWVDDEGLLIPRTASATCPVDVRGLLDELRAGPMQTARSQGLATALPPESGLELVSTTSDAVTVNLETESQISAERLPIAVGQVVLTLTSAPDIRRVSLLSNGEPVQVPLADGELTTLPVSAADYVSLVPPAYQRSTPFRTGVNTDDPARATDDLAPATTPAHSCSSNCRPTESTGERVSTSNHWHDSVAPVDVIPHRSARRSNVGAEARISSSTTVATAERPCQASSMRMRSRSSHRIVMVRPCAPDR